MHATATPHAAAQPEATPARPDSVAEQWAAFIQGTALRDLPADTIARAKSRLLDALATALAARDLPVPAVARRFAGGRQGPASVIGHPERLPAGDAAFVNATLVNGCTHDDFLAKSHPGAVVVPAALAMGEAHAGSGAALLASIVLGYDVVARAYLGAPGMLPAFRGTGVAGAIGAAAAAGKMLDLDRPGLVNALGCAAMFASGFGEGFRSGTMDVKLNVGWASRIGVSAAELAAAGATASPLAFEGESGYFRAFGRGVEHAAQATRGLGQRFLIDETVYKERPVCIFVQTPVHLALALRERHGLAPSRIERVAIRAPLPTLTNPGYTNVAPFLAPLQARISARFTVAAALLGRPVDQYAYYDNVDDAEVLALAERIELLEPGAGQDGRVDVEVTCAGASYQASGLEMDSLTPTADKVAAKFRRLTAHLPEDRADAVLRMVDELESVPHVGALMALLRAE
ncbi:MmgE/PrpD family protein [Bordetella genomosp. 13]|uniref:MmgE/PrpD family protein n=1 Tax=Bordetella genomosp. 13 TaxID=463040 RepID=UPI0011A1BACD|nr:MmgE/PrpD family protein [Bordetella genomosp. 13]